MFFLVLVTLYIINVFVTRWLNKVAYLKTKNNDTNQCAIIPFMWFIPIIPIIILIGIIIFNSDNNKIANRFKGSNW